MSITYCHHCDQYIDTDFNAEHFCDCGACMEDRQNPIDDYNDMCIDCYESFKDELQTQHEYRQTQ